MKKIYWILIGLVIVIVVFLGYLLLQTPIAGQVSGTQKTTPLATIYVQDPATGNFNVWNGLAFGQVNPLALQDGLSVLLPTGEFYVSVSAEGYDTINSLITAVEDQSIVTASINLGRKNTYWDKFVSVVSPRDKINNFALNVTPLPQQNLLRIGEFLPIITAFDKDGNKQVFLDDVADKPVVVYVFSTWNTEAQEQMDVYKQVIAQQQNRYNFIALSTMEPGSVNETKIVRGDYGLEFYKPDQKFYDDYMIISLPQFFLANNRGELRGIIVGSHSAADLVKMIDQTYTD